MKHRVPLGSFSLLIALAAFTVGCLAAPGLVKTDPDFVGRITDMHQNGSQGTVGQILLEAKVVREGTEYLDKYMVTIKDETLIFERVGQDLRPATFEALAVGQQVEVWFAGPVAESYPAQVAARQLLILDFLQT